MKRFFHIYIVPALVALAALLPQSAAGQGQAAYADTLKRQHDAELESKVATAVMLMDSERLGEAQELLKTVIAEDQENDAALFYMGILALRSQQPHVAEGYLQMAAVQDSTNYWYRYRLAQYYQIMGKNMAAIEAYEKLVADYPDDSSLLEDMLQVYMSANYINEALEVLDKLEERSGENGQMIAIRSEMLMRSDYGKYIEHFHEKVAPCEEIPLNAKEQMLLESLERTRPGLVAPYVKDLGVVIEQLLEAGCRDEKILVLASRIAYITDDFDKFLQHSWDLVNLPEVSKEVRIEALAGIGDYYAQQDGMLKKAYSIYDRVLKESPDYAPVLNNYAYFLSINGGSLKKAYAMSVKTISGDDSNMTYLDTFGWILHLMHKDAEAKIYFKKAITAGGLKQSVILDHYADVLFELGEWDTALYYYDQAMRKDTSGALPGIKEKIEERKARKEQLERK